MHADFLRSASPTTAEGIEKYLASSMIKGIGPIYTRKLVKAFRESDIRSIGFKSADQIASKRGIEKTTMIRARAGVGYALREAMDQGHWGCRRHGPVPFAVKLHLREAYGSQGRRNHWNYRDWCQEAKCARDPGVKCDRGTRTVG